MRNEQIQVMQETKETSKNLVDMNMEEGFNGHLVQFSPENMREMNSEQMLKVFFIYPLHSLEMVLMTMY